MSSKVFPQALFQAYDQRYRKISENYALDYEPKTFTGDALQAAIDAIGSDWRSLCIEPGIWNITDDLVVPVNICLWIMPGAVFYVNTGISLTINNMQLMGLYQIFDGPGTVLFGGMVRKAYPEMWEENTTPGTTDMYSAIAAAIVSLPQGGTLKLGASIYGTTSMVVVGAGHSIKIEGPHRQVDGNHITTSIKYIGAIDSDVTPAIAVLQVLSVGGVTLKNITLDANELAGFGFWLNAATAGISNFYGEGGYTTKFRKQGLRITNANGLQTDNSKLKDWGFYPIGVQPDYNVYSSSSNASSWIFEKVRFLANDAYKPKNHIYSTVGFGFETIDCLSSHVMSGAEAFALSEPTSGYTIHNNSMMRIDRFWSEDSNAGFLYFGSSAGVSTVTIRDSLIPQGTTYGGTLPPHAIYFNTPNLNLNIDGGTIRSNILLGPNVNNEQLSLSGNLIVSNTDGNQIERYLSGTHKVAAGANNNTLYVIDEDDRDLVENGAAIGQTIYNITDDAFGVITAIGNDGGFTNNKLTVVLTQGTENLWDEGDEFRIYLGLYDSDRNVGIARWGHNQEPLATYYVGSDANQWILSALAKIHRIILGASITGTNRLRVPSKLGDGDVFTVILIQDGTGSRTVLWESDYKFTGGAAPVLTTTAHAIDIIQFKYVNFFGLVEVNRALDVK
jgi:hypothetical protein